MIRSVLRTLTLGLALALLFAAAALGESARVITPKGPLNMRKTPEEKGKVVESVPNKSLVTVEEVGEEWSKITYQKKSGYVKTEFLKLPEAMVGKEIYADSGTLYLLSGPGDSQIVAAVPPYRPVAVEEIQGDWALVSFQDKRVKGYVETKALSYQREEPAGAAEWIAEAALAVEACEVKGSLDKKAEAAGTLEAGAALDVLAIEKDQCLVLTGEGLCGYAPVSAIALTGTAGDGQNAETGLSRAEAMTKAENALKKKFKAFANERLYCDTEMGRDDFGASGAFYKCCYFNGQDQYLYCAVIGAEKGEAVFLAQYKGFAVPGHTVELLPEGQVEIALEPAGPLAVGQVVDIAVQAWTLHQAQYTLYLDGAQIAQSQPGAHFSAAYRPRQPGEYRLTVTVTDEGGQTVSQEAAFTVDPDAEPIAGAQEVYSQKDGWWKDKKYRHSNLGKSGCAIFALAHALNRLGVEGEAALPENLAAKYSYCLIPEEGTNNTLLINTAARDFGFTTQSKLISEPEKIAALLREGTLFSFSIARGHIAMVSGISEDGAMIRVVDSAPQATFERIKNSYQYYPFRGGYREALSLDDLPGARWYFETDEYGGLEYWLTMDYVAGRGVRLIQPIPEN